MADLCRLETRKGGQWESGRTGRITLLVIRIRVLRLLTAASLA